MNKQHEHINAYLRQDKPLQDFLAPSVAYPGCKDGIFIQVGNSGKPLPRIGVGSLIIKPINVTGSVIGSPSEISYMLELAASRSIRAWVETRPMKEANTWNPLIASSTNVPKFHQWRCQLFEAASGCMQLALTNVHEADRCNPWVASQGYLEQINACFWPNFQCSCSEMVDSRDRMPCSLRYTWWL
jgi:hypothetical protein